MITANLNNLELQEFIAQDDSKQHCKATFPLLGFHGTTQTATVYIELSPGDNLGRHTDSAEEILLILEGEVEASVGNERLSAGQGNMVVVPAMEPHDLKNTGNTKARIMGFFGGANHIVATFEKGWGPDNAKVVDTSVVPEQA